jgi:FAD/FMN-containing dehydrogenase
MPRSLKQQLGGWGNFPVQPSHVFRPEKLRDLTAILTAGGMSSYISRGLGRSYGDAALNDGGGVILHERFNRFLSFDPATGLLGCEAGVSFAEILELFVPRGYFLPVTPGTKHITVGGAIAADVHGKNHHRDGSISSFVESFRLLTPAGPTVECSRTQEPELFWATIGGMGLTGIILSARFRLIPIETSYLRVDYQRVNNLDQALESFLSTDLNYQYSVAWIDCLATGGSLGRSVLIRGSHARAGELSERQRRQPLVAHRRPKRNVPFAFPSLVLNTNSVRAFNALYYAKHRTREGVITHYDPFFYPLDSVMHWNRIYGKRGFVQYQAVLPPRTSREGLIKLLERFSGTGRASFLAVLKSFGDANQGLLSFPTRGYTLALDIPNRHGLADFVEELDAIVLSHGGRVYLAKDACLNPDKLSVMYPHLSRFKQIKQRVDPRGCLSSSLARRVGIVS